MSARPRVFLSYSHPDQAWQVRLGKHLRVLEKLGLLDVWADSRIHAGDRWHKAILGAIDSAQVAVMLLSVDFLDSDFILNTEVPRILRRERAGQLQVVPVLVRDCTWEEVPWLAELQLRPWNAVPLAAYQRHRLDAELAAIAREVRRLIGTSVLFHPA
jgi:hypothetical protein